MTTMKLMYHDDNVNNACNVKTPFAGALAVAMSPGAVFEVETGQQGGWL